MDHEYTYSSLNEPSSFDMFDINIISLQTELLWRYEGSDDRFINSTNDFKSLKELIGSVKKSKVIICFPKNYNYQYSFYSGAYHHNCQLKDMIPRLNEHLKHLIPLGNPYEIVYENSATICEDTRYTAAFYFNNVLEDSRVLTKCIGGDHCTTYRANSNLIFTSLDLTQRNINKFFREIGIIERESEAPIWIEDFKFGDDELQEQIVSEANDEIFKQKEKIRLANKKLEENLRYKSVLYESGDALVDVVFEILEKTLKCDLSDFVDKKGEDFKITMPSTTFIGEIKGISSNVRLENVSQLDVHCNTYIDSLEEEGKSENVKGLLIINPLRNKPINEREEVHEKQIELAKRNGSLIITTETLLLLFEAYLQNHITNDKIVELLETKTGILTKNDFI